MKSLTPPFLFTKGSWRLREMDEMLKNKGAFLTFIKVKKRSLSILMINAIADPRKNPIRDYFNQCIVNTREGFLRVSMG